MLLLCNKKDNNSGIKSGYITIDDKSSDFIDDLFYLDNENQILINLMKLEDCLSVDVIRSKDLYIISTVKKQITIYAGKKEYDVNTTKIIDDDEYHIPVSVNSYIFADSDMIFKLFGYRASYRYNTDKTTIEGILLKEDFFDNNDYTELKTNVVEKNMIPEPSKQIEDQLIENKENIEPGTEDSSIEQPPLIPEATEIDTSNLNLTDKPFISDSETEEYNEETIKQTEKQHKEDRWQETKSELTNIFKNSDPNFEQNAFATLGDNGICYNQASKGTYGNTITVIKDTYDGYYMVATLSADWSDQAGNVVSEQSKKYYSGLESVYKKTLISLLGENEGTSFFEYLKEHADQKQQGGYISQYDEKGVIQSVWTDDYIGDGMRASTLELSQWTNRYTDDGLRYDIVRNGDGIMIIIF